MTQNMDARTDLRFALVLGVSDGGHFLEMEEPELLAEDIRAFFHTLSRVEP
jgi:hypothetical protein